MRTLGRLEEGEARQKGPWLGVLHHVSTLMDGLVEKVVENRVVNWSLRGYTCDERQISLRRARRRRLFHLGSVCCDRFRIGEGDPC